MFKVSTRRTDNRIEFHKFSKNASFAENNSIESIWVLHRIRLFYLVLTSYVEFPEF